MRNWIPLNTIYKTPIESDNWSIYERNNLIFLDNKKTGKCIMSDYVLEQKSCQDFMDAANGKVLVLGLGLGYILFPLLDDPRITSIDVVEIEQEIINMVGPYVKSRDKRNILKIHNGDATEWWKHQHGKWDCIYIDLWYDVVGYEREEALDLFEKYHALKAENGWLSYWDNYKIEWH